MIDNKNVTTVPSTQIGLERNHSNISSSSTKSTCMVDFDIEGDDLNQFFYQKSNSEATASSDIGKSDHSCISAFSSPPPTYCQTDMVRFEEKLSNNLSNNSLSKNSTRSEMMVKFEEGVDLKKIANLMYFPGPAVIIENRDNQKADLLELKLHLPEIKKQHEVTILSDEQAKLIKKQQKSLQILGTAIQTAERIFKGTEFYIDDGIIFNKSGEKICNFIPFIESETIHYYITKNGYDKRSQYMISIYVQGKSYQCSV